jgi:hypothetical protein
MGFVKGNDGIARTIRNPLEGAVGDISLDDISAVTLAVSANIAGGNIATAGIVSATGNIAGGNILTGSRVIASGVIETGTGFSTGGYLSVDGSADLHDTTVYGNLSVTGDITTSTVTSPELIVNTIKSDDSTIIQIQDGLEIDGDTLVNGNVIGGNLIATGNITGNTAGFAIGYRDIPQVSFTGNATIATADAGKHFYSTQSTNYILTIANNASQAFQTGSAVTIINQGTGNITVAQGSGVTLYFAGNASSGNRTLSTFGMATLIKVAADTWFINGSGVA